jgi:predicted Zn-dependent protease
VTGSLQRAALATLCVSVLSACDSPTVPAREDVYAFASLPRFSGDRSVVIRWAAGTKVRVFVNGGDAARAAVLESAFDAGARMWENAILFGEFTLTRVSDIRNADVVLTWADVALPLDVSNCPVVFGNAATTFCLTADLLHLIPFPFTSAVQGAAPSDSHVKMLVTVIGSTSSNPARANMLVAHELGHVLGIAQHSPNPQDLMFATVNVSTASHADVSTIQVLYHTVPDVTP